MEQKGDSGGRNSVSGGGNGSGSGSNSGSSSSDRYQRKYDFSSLVQNKECKKRRKKVKENIRNSTKY